MDILFILKIPPPYTGSSINNLRIYNSNLINREFNADYLLISYNNELNSFGSFTLKKVTKFIKYILQLIKKISANNYELVFFPIAPFGKALYRDLVFILLIKLFKKKILFRIPVQGLKIKSENSLLYKFIYNFIFYQQYTIVLSESLCSDLDSFKFKEKFVIPNGKELEVRNSEVNESYTDRIKKINIIFCSNLYIKKGIYDFLQTLKLLEGKYIKAFIIGKDTDEITYKELKEFIIKNNIKDVELVGAKYNGEKLAYFMKSSIFLFPSYYDAFANTVVEAMEAGLPIIGYKEGAVVDHIIHGVNGYLVNKGDFEKMAEYIMILIQKPILIKEMGMRSREIFIKKYLLKIFETNMVSAIHKIIA